MTFSYSTCSYQTPFKRHFLNVSSLVYEKFDKTQKIVAKKEAVIKSRLSKQGYQSSRVEKANGSRMSC